MERIKNVDGPNNLEFFLRDNELRNLTDKELYALLHQVAQLDSKYNLTSKFEIVLIEYKRRDERLKFIVPVVISFLALIVSIIALRK